MTGPADPFEQALTAAFTPANEVRARSEAGFRLRARAGRRQAQHTLAGLTGGLVIGAVVMLTIGSVLHGRLLQPPAGGGGGGGMAMHADDVPWDNSSSSPLVLNYGQSTLTHPVELFRVQAATSRSCFAAVTGAMDSGLTPLPDRTCHDPIRPAVLVVTHVLAVEVTRTVDLDATAVALTLGPSDSVTLADFTREHVGSRVAFVVAGRMGSPAEVSRPVETGVIEIATGQTDADAVRFVRSLGLRRDARPSWVRMPW